VLLLIELFRIHQQHWDELRRREFPSFNEIQADVTRLGEAARTFQQLSTTLLEKLPQTVPHHLGQRHSLRHWLQCSEATCWGKDYYEPKFPTV
jgi:hypothetical protein